MPNLTPEQIKDIESRHGGFMAEYGALIKKWEMQMGALPRFISIPGDSYVFHIDVGPVDLKYMPTPSPLTQPVIQKE